MIVITKVECLETPRDVVKIVHEHTGMSRYFDASRSMSQEDIKVVEASVRGRRYVHPERGIDVVIGVASSAGKQIGMMFEAWESLSKQCDEYRETSQRQGALICRIRSWNFWKRLAFTFRPSLGQDNGFRTSKERDTTVEHCAVEVIEELENRFSLEYIVKT